MVTVESALRAACFLVSEVTRRRLCGWRGFQVAPSRPLFLCCARAVRVSCHPSRMPPGVPGRSGVFGVTFVKSRKLRTSIGLAGLVVVTAHWFARCREARFSERGAGWPPSLCESRENLTVIRGGLLAFPIEREGLQEPRAETVGTLTRRMDSTMSGARSASLKRRVGLVGWIRTCAPGPRLPRA